MIQEKLFELRDVEYAHFQANLAPNITPDIIIGVRVPVLRAYAREIYKSSEAESFLKALPHKYYDENMLHGMLLSFIKDYDEAVNKVEAFLPYIDNWAVCDTLKPKAFKDKKNRDKLIDKIREWANSKHTYTIRFGIEMLMNHYLDDFFKKEYLEIPAKVISDEYYVNMMLAWYYATALAKKWDETIPYLVEKKLPVWVHNKTIQKARESFRITDKEKEYLKTLKR